MFRKLTTLLATLVVAMSLFPALANAAVTATATLTQGQSVFPGRNPYTVRVNNTGGVVGGVGGTTANYIEVVLPPNLSGATCTSATVGGFRCRSANNGRTVVLDSGTLNAGSNLDIPFTAAAARPVDRNRTTAFDVRVSDDGGTTQSSAGKPNTVVRALQIIEGSLRPAAPAGVTDKTGTTGQAITYTFSVKNHAQQGIPVAASLTSNGPDTVGTPAVTTIAAGATSPIDVPVTLGAVTGASQNRTFTATAARSDDPATTAGTLADTFTVEASPLLTLVANTFSPRAVRSDRSSYTFVVDANKANLPGVNGLTGALTFAGNTIDLGTPTSLPRNASSSPLRLSFPAPSGVMGSDGTYDASFTFRGTDDNGHPYSQSVSLNQLVTIDNIAPLINLQLNVPTGQAQVKNGDAVSVAVSVQGGGVEVVELMATIEGENGQPASTRTIPTTGCNPGATTCTARATLADLGRYGTLTAVGTAVDAALNRGTGGSNTVNIDNVLPVLAAPARIVTGTPYRHTSPVVEVTISDRFAVAGGCNATTWDVDQTTNDAIIVTEVRYSNGTPCSGGTNPGDNIRILVTNANLDPDVQYNALYFASRLGINTNDRLRDGALNSAIDQAVRTVSGIAPAVPDLAVITRNGGAENAVFDQDRYWTRFGGNDARATIRNTRAGYFIEVLDGETGNTVISTTSADGANGQTVIPIGTTPGEYVRRIRLVNASGLRSPELLVRLVLDQTAPLLARSTVTGTGAPEQVTVTFSEILWTGSNRAMDWFALERNTTPEEDPYYRYRPDSVSGNAADTRTLNVDLLQQGSFVGVEYTFDTDTPTAGLRYQDRAGNLLGNFAQR